MSTKELRDYYERLSQERLKYYQNVKCPWFVEYRMKFKDKLRELITATSKTEERPVVLILGCGCGEDFTLLPKDKNFIGIGLDISFSQLKFAEAREEFRSFRWILADVSFSPIKSSSCDMVILSEVIEHLTDCHQTLSEISRILKRDGRLFLTTPNRYEYYHLLGQLVPKKMRRILRFALQPEIDIDSSEYSPSLKEHAHLFGLKELLEALKQSGLCAVEIRGGVLNVSLPILFERVKILRKIWILFDALLDHLPFSVYLKAHFILVVKIA